MSQYRIRIALGALLVLLASTLLGCGFFTENRSVGVSAEDVDTVELYEYTWEDDDEPVQRLTIANDEANREVVEELVAMFTDMPTTRVTYEIREHVAGRQALGVRYRLTDGSTVEVTRIFNGFQEVVVIWPDGSARATEWGVPDLVEQYSEFGVVEQVDADQRPAAHLEGT